MKFTAIVALFASAQAIKVKQDTADVSELTDAQKVLYYADKDDSKMLSLEEGMTALSELGMLDITVERIREMIT